MFKSVLIANRGEIAGRIVRSCRSMGIESVAVYSDADADMPYVLSADRAYNIGAAPSKDSYLNGKNILSIAVEAGVDAIHPGYGFLSENPDFAEACRSAKIVFIGPQPEVMRVMGDKLSGRKFAQEANVPVLPGSDGAVLLDDAAECAERIGYPVLVKASAGGGGMGIQVATTPADLSSALEHAKTAGFNIFGDSKVYLEKYLERTSHVEVQVLGDGKEKVIHLFERDCSVQRRNQKLIEETPTPKLSEYQLQPIWEAACRLARRARYSGVGTLEFLVDDEGNFFFIEMNTRIQVEHPVTEMTTGLDMVEMQMGIASGDSFLINQEDVKRSGHSIEARILAEDPFTMMPVPGRVEVYREPKGVRVDSGIAEGSEIGLFYDPLICKIIALGSNREEARRKLIAALQEFRVEGVTTNVQLLVRILKSEEFCSGNYDTGIVRRLTDAASSDMLMLKHVAALAAVLAFNDEREATRDAKAFTSPDSWWAGGLRRQFEARRRL